MRKETSTDHLKYLLKETEHVFHCKVATSANCNQLSIEIRSKTSQNISSQTLRRLFGLVKTNTSPSLFTLDALSEYCGYQNWSQFCSEKETSDIPLVHTELFSKMVLDFYKVPLPKLWPSSDYYIACKNTAQHIIRDEALYRSLPSQLATLPSGQLLFFECFPYIDGLGNGYQKHLRIYLQNKAARDRQSQIFANSLLFFGSLLTKNESQLKKYYSIINSITCPIPYQMHDIPIARYIGTQILYNQHVGNPDEALLWIKKGYEYAQCYEKEDRLDFCNYFLVLSEYLFFAGRYAECIELLRYAKNPKWNQYFINKPYDLGYYEVTQAIIAISNLKLGNHDKGMQLFKKINTSSFVFTECKLYGLFYLKQQLSLCSDKAKKKRTKILNQINGLVSDTGFVYFSASIN